MSRIYWDTMLFIYILEGNPEFGPSARRIYEAIGRRGDTICTSVFTLGEVLVKPKRVRDDAVSDAIRRFMRGGEIDLLPFTTDTAEQYGAVRAQTKLKAADAIHAATAIVGKADLFITNDSDLKNEKIPGLPLVAGLDGRIATF